MRGQLLIAAWGVLGVAATLVEAIARLGAVARAQLATELTTEQWVVFGAASIALCYAEGYRALQQRFVPSVIARAFEVVQRDRVLWAVLAPLYAASLIGARPRVLVRSLAGVGAIVLAILAVRQLPAPWRGIVDGAVCIALAWGMLALLGSFAKAAARLRRGQTPRLHTR